MGYRTKPLFIWLNALLCCGALIQPVSGQILKGPITDMKGSSELPGANQDSMAGLGAPGSDAIMTQDMLLVNPNTNGKQPLPITGYIGMTLKMNVDSNIIKFKHLRGLAVTVTNDTNRPLVIDADEAVAKSGNKAYKCAPLTAVQLAVNPANNLGRVATDMVTKVAPAAASVGAVPTISDFYKYTKPPLTRYGKDQERRVVESSRFGKRILWPHEKTQGIIYFDSKAVLDKVAIEIPVATLFDKKDSGVLTSAP